MKGNFKVIGVSDYKGPDITKGRVYEFVNGVTAWDCGNKSKEYRSYEHFKRVNPFLPLERHKEQTTIVIYSKDLETIALLKEGKNVIKQATAKCNPLDEYDFNIGAKLAFDRLMGRVEQSRPNTIIKQDKYEVGDKVRLRSDLKANTRYGDVKLLPCMLNFAKGDVTIDKIWDEFNYSIKDCDFIWSKEMFEGKVIDVPSIREVKRPAKVGEWIKIVETKEPCNGYLIGDVLQVKKLINEYGTIEKPYWIASCEYVVLENYQPEATKTLSDYTDKELIDELSKRWEDKQ